MDITITPDIILATVAVISIFSGLTWTFVFDPLRKLNKKTNELDSRMSVQEENTKQISDRLKKMTETLDQYRNDMYHYLNIQKHDNAELRNHFDKKFDDMYKQIIHSWSENKTNK